MRAFTRREKILIFIFIFVLVVVGTFSGIIGPIVAHNAELKVEHEALKTQRNAMEVIDTNKEQNLIDLETSKKEVSIILDQISDPVDNASFDSRINNLTSKYGVSVKSITYNGPVVEIPQVEYMAPNQPSYEMKDDVDQINGLVVKKTGIEASTYEVITETIQISLSGSYGNMASMMDDTKSLGRTVFVSSFNYNFSDNSANMTLQVYSVDKIK